MTDDAGGAEGAGWAAERLAEEIRTRRNDAGLSQARLAARIGYTPAYVSLAERPEKGGLPSAAVVQAIDNALGAEGALVSLREQAEADQQTLRGQVSATSVAQSTITDPDGEYLDNEGRNTVNRRDLLAAGGVVAISSALPAPNSVLQALEIVTADDADTLDVAIDCLSELVSHYSERLSFAQPAEVYRDLITVRSYAGALLERVGSAPQRRDLLGAAGRLSNLLAISTSYLGNHGAALIWCVDAERRSHQSGLRDIAGWAALTRAMGEYYQGRARRSIELAVRGLTVAPVGTVAHAKLAAQQMRARAMLGDIEGMTRARSEAAKAIAALPAEVPTTGVFSIALTDDPPYTATSLLLVEQFKDAASATRAIIDSAYSDARARGMKSSGYARTLLILALAEAGLGRVNEAVAFGREALDIQGVVWPTLVLVGKLDQVLQHGYGSTGDVAAFHSLYRDLARQFSSYALTRPEA